MSVPAIAHITVNRQPTGCAHPLEHVNREPFAIGVDEDGRLSCPHGTVPETDARWMNTRIDLLMEVFKEAIWCLGEHGVEGLQHPETIPPRAA